MPMPDRSLIEREYACEQRLYLSDRTAGLCAAGLLVKNPADMLGCQPADSEGIYRFSIIRTEAHRLYQGPGGLESPKYAVASTASERGTVISVRYIERFMSQPLPVRWLDEFMLRKLDAHPIYPAIQTAFQ